MPSFTCITCRVAFADSEIQRGHYKSDWHRYNLKRKVAELAPVTAEVFQEKVMAQKAEVEAQAQNKSITLHCDLCNKSFSSENAHANHLQSKKHKTLVEKDSSTGSLNSTSTAEGNRRSRQTSGSKEIDEFVNGKPSDAEDEVEMDEEEEDEEIEEEAIEITDCLFCPHQSRTLEDNMKHMSRSHSFFIPDLEYVVDLQGLMGYLGEKVGVGNMCLYCNEKSKNYYSIEAVQSHMVDKGHTKINYEGDAVLEYADFYDFSTSYPDFNPGQVDENEEQELEARNSSLVVDEATSELCLPSGARLGHRDLRHIYKQHLPPDRRLQTKVVKNLMADYRALGWHGTVGEVARQRVRDIRLARKKQAKHSIKLSVKANKLQTHFRAQVMF